MFGDNKIVLKQKAKDGIWIYEEIQFNNKGIFGLIDLVPTIIKKAEENIMKGNKNKISGVKGLV